MPPRPSATSDRKKVNNARSPSPPPRKGRGSPTRNRTSSPASKSASRDSVDNILGAPRLCSNTRGVQSTYVCQVFYPILLPTSELGADYVISPLGESI